MNISLHSYRRNANTWTSKQSKRKERMKCIPFHNKVHIYFGSNSCHNFNLKMYALHHDKSMSCMKRYDKMIKYERNYVTVSMMYCLGNVIKQLGGTHPPRISFRLVGRTIYQNPNLRNPDQISGLYRAVCGNAVTLSNSRIMYTN
jgi:hypothetical protein